MTDINRIPDVPTELADAIVSAARTSLSDTLRSVVYFTPSAFDVLYVRSDLYDTTEEARAVKAKLVDFEVTGFAEAPVRTAVAVDAGPNSIGAYEFTVRFHEHGFVVRALGDDAGVIMTADSMDVSAFEDAVSAIRPLLKAD